MLTFMQKVRVKRRQATSSTIQLLAEPDAVELFAGHVGHVVGKKGSDWTVAFESPLYPTPVEASFREENLEEVGPDLDDARKA